MPNVNFQSLGVWFVEALPVVEDMSALYIPQASSQRWRSAISTDLDIFHSTPCSSSCQSPTLSPLIQLNCRYVKLHEEVNVKAQQVNLLSRSTASKAEIIADLDMVSYFASQDEMVEIVCCCEGEIGTVETMNGVYCIILGGLAAVPAFSTTGATHLNPGTTDVAPVGVCCRFHCKFY